MLKIVAIAAVVILSALAFAQDNSTNSTDPANSTNLTDIGNLSDIVNVTNMTDVNASNATVNATNVTDSDNASIVDEIVEEIEVVEETLPGVSVHRLVFMRSGQTYTIPIDDMELAATELKVSSARNLTNVSITVEKLDSIGFPGPNGTAYQYVKVGYENFPQSALRSLMLKFSVDKKWLVSNGLDDAYISLQRYSDGWQLLTIQFLGETDAEYFFDSELGSFSTAAIIIEEVPEPVAAEPDPEPEPTPVARESVAAQVPVGLIILAVIAVAGLGGYWYYIRAQNRKPFRYAYNPSKPRNLSLARKRIFAKIRLKYDRS